MRNNYYQNISTVLMSIDLRPSMLRGICYSVHKFITWLCLLVLLVGCDREVNSPVLIFNKTFTNFERNAPLLINFDAKGESAVLIKVFGHELITEARVFDQVGELVNEAKVDYRRSVPLFLVIDPISKQSNYLLEILPKLTTINSNIVVEIAGLPLINDKDKERLAAYKLYSDSVQLELSQEGSLWQKRMEKFKRASIIFKKLGMHYEQLWADFLSTTLTYYPIGDVQTALPAAAEISDHARRLEYPDLMVMALQLKGQSLMFRDTNESSESAKNSLSRSMAVFAEVAVLAKCHEQEFQRVWAINNLAIAHHYAGNYILAIKHFREALKLSDPLQDPYLKQVLNSNMAAGHQVLGEFSEALSLLEEVTDYQRQQGQLMELSFSLKRLGDVNTQLFQFSNAIDAYSESLQISRSRDDDELIGMLALALGQAHYELGYMERALDYIEESVVFLEQVNAGAGLFHAHGTSANIHRFLGNHTQSIASRQLQSKYQTSDYENARSTFEHGKDVIANPEKEIAASRPHFLSSLEMSKALDERAVGTLSQLYLCNSHPSQPVLENRCNNSELEKEFLELVKQGKPRDTFEAKLLWSEYLTSVNRVPEAIGVLNKLVEEITFFRSNIPGVLGSWYWESRSKIFQWYMDLQIKLDQIEDQGGRSFMLLDRLRNVDLKRHQILQPGMSRRLVSEIRNLMAKIDNAGNQKERISLKRELELKLLERRVTPMQDYIESDDLRLEHLLKVLDEDTAILTFYFSANGVYAWLLKKDEIKLHKVSERSDVANLIQSTLRNIRTVGHVGLNSDLDKLGLLLLQPLSAWLPVNIYFIPGGPFSGFPFEALRFEEQFLAEKHNTVNIISIDATASSPSGVLSNWMPESIFLAGNPSGVASGLPELQGSLSELQAIKSIMLESSVSMVSGDGFKRSVLSSPAFQSAELVHLASHGVLDLDYPELSRVTLSSSSATYDEYLTPAEIPGLNLNANLVVLSACKTTGNNSFRFDSSLGFVTELLGSGTKAVMASIFPVSDKTTTILMADFYTELFRSHNVSDALTAAKRKHIGTLPVRDWVGFQLIFQ